MQLSPQSIMHNNSSFPYRRRHDHTWKKCFAIIHHLFNQENFFVSCKCRSVFIPMNNGLYFLFISEWWNSLFRSQNPRVLYIKYCSLITTKKILFASNFYHSVYLFCKTEANKSSIFVYCGGCIECSHNYLFALKK